MHKQAEFPALESATLRHDVIKVLKRAILDGALQPGMPLRQAELAEQMGISRAPVREALQHLEQLGLATYTPHKGYTITEFRQDDVRELYGLRLSIEPYALALAMPQFKLNGVVELDTIVDRMRDAANRDDIAEVIHCDLDFHRGIYEQARHKLLHRIWLTTIETQLCLFLGVQARFRLVLHDDPRDETEMHAKLLDTIRGGDGELAVRTLQEHIKQLGELAISTWPEEPWNSQWIREALSKPGVY